MEYGVIVIRPGSNYASGGYREALRAAYPGLAAALELRGECMVAPHHMLALRTLPGAGPGSVEECPPDPGTLARLAGTPGAVFDMLC